MSFSIYEATAPVSINAMTNMVVWLHKAQAERDESNCWRRGSRPTCGSSPPRSSAR